MMTAMEDFEPVDPSFFERDALVVARALIGSYLVVREAKRSRDVVRAVRIVETEAYRGPKDAACHARFGLTSRTRTLLGPPGRAYVFLIYGMYDCFNAVCGRDGSGHAVLIRAGEPIEGIADAVRSDGPGRLARALHITRAHDGSDLTSKSIFIAPRTKCPRIAVSARVGVAYAGATAAAPWRFFDATSPFVSRPAKRTIGLGGT
jgi:DNA-3-methyladenine glycosylase